MPNQSRSLVYQKPYSHAADNMYEQYFNGILGLTTGAMLACCILSSGCPWILTVLAPVMVCLCLRREPAFVNWILGIRPVHALMPPPTSRRCY